MNILTDDIVEKGAKGFMRLAMVPWRLAEQKRAPVLPRFCRK